jgi:hypothetical protein
MRAGGFWAAQVVDADPDAAVPWIASQYVDGPSLAERVARQGPLDEAEVRRLGSGLAEALATFHKAGLVHRDLKPSNVLLQHDGPRVIDFGVSKALEPLDTAGAIDLTRAGTILGTPGFMAPEQALGKPAGPPADVFSLGSLLVHAATGAPPFGTGASHALLYRVVYEEPELGGVPYGLRQLIADCLRKAPEERPAADALVARFAAPRPRAVPDPRIAPKASGASGAETGVKAGVRPGAREGAEPGVAPGVETEAPTVPSGAVPKGATTTAPHSDEPAITGAYHGTSGLLKKLGLLRRLGLPRKLKLLRKLRLRERLTKAAVLRLPWPARRTKPPAEKPIAEQPEGGEDATGGAADPDGFAVGEWGRSAFRRRMRQPLGLALGLDAVLLPSAVASDAWPAFLGYAIVATLLCVLYGLTVSLPLRRPRMLRVGPDGLSVRQGPHRLTVPWREITTVGFIRRKKRGLALTATLDDTSRTAVPRPLTGAGGVLTCRVVLPFRKDVEARARGLETALRTYAGDRYPAGQGPTG